jgi:dipeptidyl aminopeptidase/acylaminoacyl peptidase
LISRNGKRYLVVFQRGDVARNGSWVEVLSGSTASLDAASRATVVARLFSKSTALVTDLVKNVRWLDDNEHVAFLWDDGAGLPQVIVIDIRSHQIRRLTHHPALIEIYDISRDGQTIIYTARGMRSSSRVPEMRRNGFAITGQSIGSLLSGELDGWTPWLHHETFVSSTRTGFSRKVKEPLHKWLLPPYLLNISPNGRYAIAVRPAGDVPADWDKYTEHIFRDVYLPPVRQHPGDPHAIRQYYIVDTLRAVARPLWNAPENPYGGVVWSPDSRSFIVGPTFLPTKEADKPGLAGWAVAEVDVTTGMYVQVPLPPDLSPTDYRPLSWQPDGVIEFTDTEEPQHYDRRLKFRKSGGQWKPIPEEQVKKDELFAPVRIELRQGPNTPPALYAVETASGREKLIRDLNPQLRRSVTLGRVELVHWKGTDDRPWTGMLYYPVHYAPGRRFPLVIQTHGYNPTEFSIDGGFTTVFAAQPLANHDIAVLQIGSPDTGMEEIIATPREPAVYTAGFEGAIEEFTRAGLVDREKVGIVGFSRTGWHVEYALSHSQFPFAAAEVADNMDASYVQNVMWQNSEPSEFEADNGARPFGKGLEAWLRVAPGFNADKVQSPLRIEIDSGPVSVGAVNDWEMFSNLRYLGKPVELFVIPDNEHGVHILQNPAQRLASQGGTVDWFCFWLRGEEDPDRAKADQYTRWRKLLKLQERAIAPLDNNP